MYSVAHAELEGDRCGISLEKGMTTYPVFLPGEFHAERSLVSYSPWAHKVSDTTEQLTHTHTGAGYSLHNRLAF